MALFESIASGILVNLVYDLAKQSVILFKGDFYDKLLDVYNDSLKESGVENKRIRKQYLDKIAIFLNKRRPNERDYTPEELANALDCNLDFVYKLLGHFEINIIKNDTLYKWVRNEYSKETIDVLKRILTNVEIISKRFIITKADEIQEFDHIGHLRRIKEKNIIPRKIFYKKLDEWYFNSSKAMMLLYGLGGTGKTIIGWEWKELLKQLTDDLPVKHIFVWSFYDFHANFENFVNTLLVNDFGKNPESIKNWHTRQKAEELLTLLNNKKTLLFLDGFEKELLAYKNITDEYYDHTSIKGDRQLRQFKTPECKRFIEELSILENCKTLISTRVIPEGFPDIEDPGYSYKISGSETLHVEKMEDHEILDFVRSYEIKGTDKEIIDMARKWNNHPLSLRLLINHLDFKRKNNPDFEPHIQDAPPIDELETDRLKKVLKTISDNTPKREKLLLMQMSAFRVYSMNYPMLIIFRQDESITEFKQVLQNLYDLGLITCSVDNAYKITDDTEVNIHPLIRHYFHEELRKLHYWKETHECLVHFFKVFIDDTNKYETVFGKMYQKIQAREGYKVNTLNDLIPDIELYHHLVGAGRFDEARDLFRDRIHMQVFYQLAAYNLQVELLKELFPDGEDKPPHLKAESAQGWTLNALANSYSFSGQPDKAVSIWLLACKIVEKEIKRKNFAVGLGNVACVAQLSIGQLTAAAAHLRKGIVISQEIGEEFDEAIGHVELGHILLYQGKSNLLKVLNLRKIEITSAEDELNKAKAMNIFRKNTLEHTTNYTSVYFSYYSLSTMLQSGLAIAMNVKEINPDNLRMQALKHAYKALEFAEKFSKVDRPVPRDFIWAYWLLGEALIQCKISAKSLQNNTFEIHFYDEHFQQIIEKAILKEGNELEVAERCLNEALRRCRKVNLVELEPDILLAWARLEWEKWRTEKGERRTEIIEYIKEAHGIAERAGYRLKLADIHLFCGEVQLEMPEESLLGLSASEHLQKAKEYAKDVSTFDDLYKSPDPHFYDGIPEYEMLKRGMTVQERIENGYWVAYKIAEALEKKLERK